MLHWSVIYPFISEWSFRLTMLVYVPRQRTAPRRRGALVAVHFLAAVAGHRLLRLGRRFYLPKDRLVRQERASKKDPPSCRSRWWPRGPRLCQSAAQRLGRWRRWPPGWAIVGARYRATGWSCSRLPRRHPQRLIADIDAARRHIHLLYYIYEDDATGRRVGGGAGARGGAGRAVPGVAWTRGGVQARSAPAGPEMRRRGIEVTAPCRRAFSRRNAARFDLRNHRKSRSLTA